MTIGGIMDKTTMIQNKINDMEEFALNVMGATSETIKNVFEESCTDLLKSQILELSHDGSLQSAMKELGNWYNSPSLQNFLG